jgi:glucokinase
MQNRKHSTQADWESCGSLHWVTALDIGGTHITSVAVDVEKGQINESSRRNLAVDAKGSRQEILQTWREAVSGTMKAIPCCFGLLGLGAAMPGPFDYDKGICLMKGLGKYDSLYGLNIRRFFKKTLEITESLPLIFRNDAVCFLLGESWKGAAVHHEDVIGITLGTGFGSAFMRKGVILEGIEGEGRPPGGWFYSVPYKNGMADDYFSIRGLLGRYQNETGHRLSSVIDLAQRASKEAEARKVFEKFGHELAGFLAPWLDSFKPDCLVTGGNIARAWQWFGVPLVEDLRKSSPHVDVKPSVLFEDAALLGAALLPLRFKEPADPNLTER